jgi:hypothetical protein
MVTFLLQISAKSNKNFRIHAGKLANRQVAAKVETGKVASCTFWPTAIGD